MVYVSGNTVTPVRATVHLPLTLFTKGKTATVKLTNTWGSHFTQTWTLTSAPKQ